MDWQLKEIKNEISKMDKSEIKRLRKQKRKRLSCPLRDIEKKCCSVYSVRPLVCRQQGFFVGLPCPHNPKYPLASKRDGWAEIEANEKPGEILAGILGVNIGWNELVS